jgi:Flp pilus assembly protein TadG
MTRLHGPDVFRKAPRSPGATRDASHGAALAEAVIVLPLLLFIVLAILQAASVFLAKSSLNHATHEAARAGTVHQARVDAIHVALQRALIPYYGGGRTLAELQATAARVAADVAAGAVRVEILSPTQESFRDYNSPQLQAQWRTGEPVIPNVGLDELTCPRDVPACAGDPRRNASGQSLGDANLLKLRITYGIPPLKQWPLAGRFYTWALDRLGAARGDAFVQGLIDARRIPVVAHTVMRMQSDAIRNTAMVSAPGPGNAGSPADPGPAPISSGALPTCPWWDPACTSCPADSADCAPQVCPGTG